MNKIVSETLRPKISQFHLQLLADRICLSTLWALLRQTTKLLLSLIFVEKVWNIRIYLYEEWLELQEKF